METNCKSSLIFNETLFRTSFFPQPQSIFKTHEFSSQLNFGQKLFLHQIKDFVHFLEKDFYSLSFIDYLLDDRIFYISTMINLRLILDVSGMTKDMCRCTKNSFFTDIDMKKLSLSTFDFVTQSHMRLFPHQMNVFGKDFFSILLSSNIMSSH